MKGIRFCFSSIIILALMMATGVSAQAGEEGLTQQGQVLEAPVLGSALLNYNVLDEDGEIIGNIGGFVIDSSANQIHYLSIDTDELFDEDRLVPWGAFQLLEETAAVDTTDEDLGDEDVFDYDPLAFALVLPIEEDVFDETAPGIDEALLTDFETLTPGWDDEIGAFWADYDEEVQVTGLGDEVEPENLFFVSDGLFDGIDFNVYNFDEELLGEIENYIINPDGSVPFALLETDAFLDIGDELVVVSMEALVWDIDNEVYFLNIEEGVLELAPRFDPLVIPDFRTPGWETEWNEFWVDNVPRVDEDDAGMEMDPTVLRDDLFGAEAFDLDNQALGTVEALVFRGGTVLRYLIIEDPETGEFRAVPWGFFSYEAETGDLTFTGDPGALEEAPAFDSINEINVTDPDWDADIEAFWSEQDKTLMATPPAQRDEALTPSVTVEDQPIENGMVTVPRAVSTGPGWMVIHADDNGAPGAVIGFSEVTEGVNEDIMVEIDEAQATETLYAMLHSDTGVAGEYEFPDADPPVTVDGQVVVQPFTITEAQVTEMEEPVTEDGGAMGMATVDMSGTSFDPAEITIQAGTEVTWNNGSSLPHTVTSDNGLFDSGTLQPDDDFSYTFEEPGEYPYYCEIHGGPGGQGMSGVVTVTE